jgi:DNA-binding response OmpR family regulator
MEPDVQLSPRVLLAVGDATLRRVVSAALRGRGFSVAATTDEEAALTLARSFLPDVAMIDLDLMDPDGGSLFDTVRNLTDAYIIGIATSSTDAVRIRALRSGADDVVSVPVSPDELAARGEALLRRPRGLHTRWDPLQATVMHLGPLMVDVGRKEIRVNGAEVGVTRIEFALFEQLCRRPSEVCTRSQLLEEVWGPNWVGDTHVVDVHLSNLRRKLQSRAMDIRFIHTVRGVGFRLSSDLLNEQGLTRIELESA